MGEIQYKRCSNSEELTQILNIQRRNLPASLSDEEKDNEGFVTVSHNQELLSSMNETCAHIIAKSGNDVVGYALCMHPDFADRIPVLRPMFRKIEKLTDWDGNYIVMGQVCIDKPYRKKGIFRGLYEFMSLELQSNYSCIITEVDSRNQRSLHAHYSLGFKDLQVYRSGNRLWHIIRWPI